MGEPKEIRFGNLKKACWANHFNNSYPDTEILISKQIIFLIDGIPTIGYYHCNGCFYESIGKKRIIDHTEWNHKSVTYWCYLDEFSVCPNT